MKVGPFRIHRLEQWDLNVRPIVCVHRDYATSDYTGSRRVFCLWFWGWSR